MACASARTSGARPSLVISLRLVIGIADVAGLDQHGRRFGPAQHVECGELVRPRAKLDAAGRAAQRSLREPRRRFHLLAQATSASRARTLSSGSLDSAPSAPFSASAKRAASALEATSDSE